MKKSIKIALITVTVLFCITAVISLEGQVEVPKENVRSISEAFDVLSEVHVMSDIYVVLDSPQTIFF